MRVLCCFEYGCRCGLAENYVSLQAGQPFQGLQSLKECQLGNFFVFNHPKFLSLKDRIYIIKLFSSLFINVY